MDKKTSDNKSKKHFKVPHVYVILLAVIAICAVLTHIIPAGEYARIEGPGGRMIVEPDGFEYVEPNPAGLFDILLAVPKGMEEMSTIIFFVFIVGGAFAVVNATGAINAAIISITKSVSGKEKIVIPIGMIIFSLPGAIAGLLEEMLPFIPIMVALTIKLGFDSITGAAIVLIGTGMGFAAAFMNPFTVGVAQGIAELPLFSGMGYRFFCYCCMLVLSIFLVYRYASKVKEDPSLSLMYEFDKTREDALILDESQEFTSTHKIILLIVVITILILIVGIFKLEWYITELAALFLGMGIVVALVGGLGLNGFAENLIKGMGDLAGGALVIGFARGIMVVLTEGRIIDTILFTIASSISSLPSVLAALGMYVFQCLLNYIIPSGGGQAAVTMPIMAPLSDLVGVNRQVAVLAYQFGDGISNYFTPTSGYFMAGLALAKIPWDKWARWILPIILLQYLAGGILVTIAHIINLGPF